MRKSWRVRLFVLAGLAIVVYLGASVYLTERDAPQPPSNQQQIIIKGGVVTGNRISSKSWTFTFDRATTTPDGSIATVYGVRDGVLYRAGKPYLKIDAKEVNINTTSFDFTALGAVHLESLSKKQQRSFDTDLVSWSNATKILRLDHPSYIHTGKATLQVRSLLVDFNKGELHLGELSGNVDIKP